MRFAHADGHISPHGLYAERGILQQMVDGRDHRHEGLRRQSRSRLTKLGENHVYFLPYLMGERSPHNDPDARANLYRYDDGYDKSGYDAGCAGRRGVCHCVILWK